MMNRYNYIFTITAETRKMQKISHSACVESIQK